MTLHPILLAAVLSFLTCWAGHSAETANGRLYCTSPRFSRGEADWGLSTLDLTTINTAYNGELLTYYDNRYGGWVGYAGFALDSFYVGEPIYGELFVPIPASMAADGTLVPVDANGNGFDDFFEVAQPTGYATTWGGYSTAIGGGTASATWSRPAGSKNGTCVLHLIDDDFGDLGSFSASFEVLEYTGPVTFTPGAHTVTGRLDLTQTGNAANRFQGPVQFVKSTTNRFNELTLQAGTLTNALLQTFSFGQQTFYHDDTWPTNYYGGFAFTDGDPATSEPDYTRWMLSIDDLNDANRNGIPDFSDDPAVAAPRSPQLALRYSGGSLTLTIAGDVGHVHQIQEATSLESRSWTTVQTVTLTNDPHMVTLSMPAAARFWRVLAQ